MSRTIQEGFRDFLRRLTPWSTESEAAKRHRASIEACLQNNFGLKRFVRIGSFGNGTSISGHSDVDILACLPTDQLTENSRYSLIKVRSALDRRFPNTGVCVRSPAVTVPFGSLTVERTEIVPADYVGEHNGYPVYDIADGANGWMKVGPDAHNAYVRAVDERHRGKVKPLIRFVKAWKYLRSVPLSSFYLEMRVAKYAAGETEIIYEIDVMRIFRFLLECGLADMLDPMSVSGHIRACKSPVSRVEALTKLRNATIRAEKAWAMVGRGNVKAAFFWWRMLWGSRFPTYYNS